MTPTRLSIFIVLLLALAGSESVAQTIHRKVPVISLDSKPSGPPVILYDSNPENKTPTGPGKTTKPGKPELHYVHKKSENGTPQVQRSDSVSMDRRTKKEGVLNYHAVFNPAVIPFKRNESKDVVLANYQLVVGSKSVKRITLLGNKRVPGRELFWGSIQVRFARKQLVPIPSVSPDSNVLTVVSRPAVKVSFYKDGADNYFVQADHDGVVRLTYLMDARTSYFSMTIAETTTERNIPTQLLRSLPAAIQQRAKLLWPRIGVSRQQSYKQRVEGLVKYFRAFTPGQITRNSGDLYTDLTLSQKGVCRHRTFAFLITALSLGIPARYIANEAHVFAEVYIPRAGWLRVDLGGGAEGLRVHNAKSKLTHRPQRDLLPRPGRYQNTYSNRILSGRGRSTNRIRGVPRRFRSLPNQRPGRVVSDPSLRQIPTRTRITALNRTVFRGDQLQVRGVVAERNGKRVAGIYVQIAIWNARRTRVVSLLGLTLTNARGEFDETFRIPRQLSTGKYQLLATAIGTTRHSASISR